MLSTSPPYDRTMSQSLSSVATSACEKSKMLPVEPANLIKYHFMLLVFFLCKDSYFLIPPNSRELNYDGLQILEEFAYLCTGKYLLFIGFMGHVTKGVALFRL